MVEKAQFRMFIIMVKKRQFTMVKSGSLRLLLGWLKGAV